MAAMGQRRTFQVEVIVEGAAALCDEVVDSLYASGCDDAIVSETDGRLLLEFDREADSLPAAMSSALRDTVSSGISWSKIRVFGPGDDADSLTSPWELTQVASAS